MSTLVPDVASWFASATREREGGFIQHELASNKLIHGVREVEALREILLNAASNDMDTTDSDADVHLLVPQSVTLDEVEVTPELVETHCVLLQRGANGQPRGFRSLNGLCGTCQPDDTVVVHGRRPRAATASGWNFGARGTVPQLESHIHILREAQLQPSAQLPLRAPLSLLLISDPLFYPGCGWKLPLALDLVTHRFSDAKLDKLALADVPALLFEYQILARAWWQLTKPAAPPEDDECPGEAREDNQPKQQVIVVGEDIVTFVHPSTTAAAAAAAAAAATTAAATDAATDALALALAVEDPYADAAADADADALYTRLAASLEPRTPSLAAATRAYAAAAHASTSANANADPDAAAAADADADAVAVALCSPASLLSSPSSISTPGRAAETPRPACLVSPGVAAQPSLMD